MKLRFLPIIIIVTALAGCTGARTAQYTLTIAHLNDTHSHAEGVPVAMTIDGQRTVVQAGGYPRLQTLINEMRATTPDMLLLHAGDAVQGTLYYTLFRGTVDFDFLNRLGVDAMTFGNHEFDGGLASIAAYLERAKFPIVSSNIDFSAVPAIASQVPNLLVKEVHGERIGFIGVTTETTPRIVVDVGSAKFMKADATARRDIAALEAQGVNKIVVLSHLGYAEDLKLAAAVNGIDVIVGGHSHSLLGRTEQLSYLGLTPEGTYPTEVTTPEGGRSLVVQAWQWGTVLGRMAVSFDPAGKVTSYSTGATFPIGSTFTRNGSVVPPESPAYLQITETLKQTGVARVFAEDPATIALLAPYTAQLDVFRGQRVATADTDLVRGLNSGPGVVGADSMLVAVPGAQIAILNYGSVRKDVQKGVISVGDVLEVMPFANTLVVVDLSGAELKSALEEGIEFLQMKYGDLNPPALPYVAGISFAVTRGAPNGRRVGSLRVRDENGRYMPVEATVRYRTVVNSFVAKGGDGFISIRNSPGFRSDTGIIDSDALRQYLESLGTVHNPVEPRVLVLPPVSPSGSGNNLR